MEAIDILAVPLVSGLVEAIKRMEKISPNYMPLVALILGLGISTLINWESTWQTIILSGLFFGLSAVGLYEGVKSSNEIRLNSLEQDTKGMPK